VDGSGCGDVRQLWRYSPHFSGEVAAPADVSTTSVADYLSLSAFAVSL
jgi:hypothetical protein